MPPIAYSYNRYSSPPQAAGDSVRRPTALARGGCARHGAALDTATTYAYHGVSAFRGKNRETGMLNRFREDVEAGRIPRGSILLLENMDRFSRERPVPAVHALTGILLAGIRVVQLAPDELELTEDSDLFSLLRGQLAQARGHDESKTKSGRLAEVWGVKKDEARETGAVQTTRCPAWLVVVGRVRDGKRMRGGEYRVLADRAKVIGRVFDLACTGHGLARIVRELTGR